MIQPCERCLLHERAHVAARKAADAMVKAFGPWAAAAYVTVIHEYNETYDAAYVAAINLEKENDDR